MKDFPVDGGLVDDPRRTMETLANAPEQDEEEVDDTLQNFAESFSAHTG